MWQVVTYRCAGCGYLSHYARDELRGEETTYRRLYQRHNPRLGPPSFDFQDRH